MQTEKARARQLWISFNITPAEWDTIAVYQRGRCYACGQPAKGRRLSTDHSHTDGLVRGLLCQSCNALLGKIENAFKRYGLHKISGVTVASILGSLSSYLLFPPAVSALGRKVYGYPGRIGTKEYRKWAKGRRYTRYK
jgi:hypothetical protein